MSDPVDAAPEPRELGLSLDEVVRAVPGVVGLSAAEPTLLRAAKETIGVLLGDETPNARVSVKRADGAVTVEANIAVAAERSAPAVATAVHQAIVQALPALDAAGDRSITVRVIDIVPSGSQE